MLVGAAVLYFTKIRHVNKIISSLIASIWLFFGVVYLLYSFSYSLEVIPGILFIIEGLLFLFIGVFRERIYYSSRVYTNLFFGFFFVFFAMGLRFPFQAVIATFGFLLATDKKVPKVLLVIPWLLIFASLTVIDYLGWFGLTLLFIIPIVATIMMVYDENKKR
jgi:hypothetical protein